MKHCLLWRHAEAEDFHSQGDSARCLTVYGRAQAERAAYWLVPLAQSQGWHPHCVVSPAARTQQTVEPLLRQVAWPMQTELGLAPDASTPSALSILHQYHADCLIVVGHQPTLGALAAHWLGSTSPSLSVKKGAIWWFQWRAGRDDIALRAVFYPDGIDA